MTRPAVPLLVVLLAATPAGAAPQWIAGRWFGTGQPNDKSEMWLEEGGADGSFHVLFRACHQGKAVDMTNDGHWELNGNAETITVEAVNGQKIVPRIDRYTILSHDAGRQVYRYELSGFVYTSHRVDATFRMPSCDLTS
ncbi:MAG: hypothetical protein JO256_10160 [Alphaproteobacteria bacterium]|nr:hypothetical protein [Alphaproteobacteria bacterium]